MLDLKTFIELCIKKKGYTYTEFVERVNRIKFKLGDKGIMRINNISEILNSNRDIDERTLLIWEVALDLPENTLVNLSSKRGKTKKNNEVREKLRK